MKLPTLVITSFHRNCLADINGIEKFLTGCNPDDLVAGTESSARRQLERLQLALWQQWCRMDMAWRNHQPADGNVGTETLDGLGKIVEATGMAVADMLQISGRSLETKHETGFPDLTMSQHENSPTVVIRRQRLDVTNGETSHTAATTTFTVFAKADGSKKEATSDNAGETCGGAAMVPKRIVVDIDRDDTDILPGNNGYVAYEEMDPGQESWDPHLQEHQRDPQDGEILW